MARIVQLYRIAKNENAHLILSQLEETTTIFERARGLLGRKSLNDDQGMWIRPGNNIHTFFMKFSIDCLFINKNMVIEKIQANIAPFKIAGPYWKSTSVIELKAGMAEKLELKIGDQLYVVG